MAVGIMSSAQASTTGIQVPTLFQRSLDFWSLGLGGNHIAMFLQVRRHRRKGKRPQLRRPGRRPRVGVCGAGDVGASFSNGKARSLPTKAARRAVSGKDALARKSSLIMNAQQTQHVWQTFVQTRSGTLAVLTFFLGLG